MVVDKDYIEFLEKLREQGIVHMWGLAPYLKEAFDITIEEAQEYQNYYINNYEMLAKEFNWEEREARRESSWSRIVRLKDARTNYKYYEHLLNAAEIDPAWFSVYTLTSKFPEIKEDTARELLKKFVINFDITTTMYYNPTSLAQENSEAGLDE